MSPRFDEISIGANAAEARRATEWLEATCQQLGVPREQAERVVLCLDEVLANVITHGGKTALSQPIKLRLEVRRDQECSASVTVSDAGMAFNPLTVPKRVTPKTLDEALPGGMGLALIRRCSSLLHYRHEDGHNHLTFGTRWGA